MNEPRSLVLRGREGTGTGGPAVGRRRQVLPCPEQQAVDPRGEQAVLPACGLGLDWKHEEGAERERRYRRVCVTEEYEDTGLGGVTAWRAQGTHCSQGVQRVAKGKREVGGGSCYSAPNAKVRTWSFVLLAIRHHCRSSPALLLTTATY